jgi:hypothetical protein
MSRAKGDAYDSTAPQSWEMIAAPTGTPGAEPEPTSTAAPTPVRALWTVAGSCYGVPFALERRSFIEPVTSQQYNSCTPEAHRLNLSLYISVSVLTVHTLFKPSLKALTHLLGVPQLAKEELLHEMDDELPDEDAPPEVKGVDLVTQFLALMGCLVPLVVLYHVRSAMGAPPKPQVCTRPGRDDHTTFSSYGGLNGFSISHLTLWMSRRAPDDPMRVLLRRATTRSKLCNRQPGRCSMRGDPEPSSGSPSRSSPQCRQRR